MINYIKKNIHTKEFQFFLGILLITILSRLLFIESRPAHHDEGVNGWFVLQMAKEGFYRYDPSNYHGPLFFYLLQTSEVIFGRGIFALRFVAAFFSILNVVLVWMHRRFFGKVALWAALFMMVSPAMVFYGRYAIHESLFLTFQILFSYGFFLYSTSPRKGFFWMTVGFFGAFMTKETFFIYFTTFAIAYFLAKISSRFLPFHSLSTEEEAPNEKEATETNEPRKESRKERKKRRREEQEKLKITPIAESLSSGYVLHVVGGFLLFTILLYSGFLLNPAGCIHMVSCFAPWISTGIKSGYTQPFFYWLSLFQTYEYWALVALLSMAIMLWKSSQDLRLWCLLAFGLLLAYSIIPYKTPWNILGILFPFAFVLGYFIEWMKEHSWPRVYLLWASAFVLLFLGQIGRTVHLNCFHYANLQERYVYTHTHISQNDFLERLRLLLEKDPSSINMPIRIAIRQTWPLPWTISHYQNVHYGLPPRGILDEDVLLVDIADVTHVESRMKAKYHKIRGKLRAAYTDIVYYYKASRFQETWKK